MDWYKEALGTFLETVEYLDTHFSDCMEWEAGWMHHFVCPECASMLCFEHEIVEYEKNRFVCSNCGNTVSGEIYQLAWLYQYRRWYAEHLIYVALCKDEKRAIEYLIKYVDFYTVHYDKLPIHGNKSGKGKIMGQSLDEAVFGIHLARAIYYCKDKIDKEKLNEWYEKMFLPMAEFLEPQGMSIHNISVWIWACIGIIGIVFENDLLVESAIKGKYGLFKQMQKGLTDDYLWQEGSLHYHYFALNALTFFCELCKEYDPKNELILIMIQMYQAPLKLSYDQYHLPALNDGWYPLSLSSYANQILRAGYITKDLMIQKQMIMIEKNTPELLADPDVALLNAVFKNHQTVYDRHVGVLKEPFHIQLKSGSLVLTHMHRDCLSVIISPFSEDLGTPGYGSVINDKWYRSPLSHNSISIDGKQNRKVNRNEVKDIPNGLEAVVYASEGNDLIRATRTLYKKNETIEDVTIIATENQHVFEWTFHSEGEARYSCKGDLVEYLDKKDGYAFFKDIRKMVCRDSFAAEFRMPMGKTLYVNVYDTEGMEVFTARTPGYPADVMRQTILLRSKGNNARFRVAYRIEETTEETVFEKQLSIILPCYNTEKYISECIESVCNQKMQNIEVICVDDGSTDGTAEIIKEWEKRDSRVILIHQENKGPSAARNAGLRVARGKYVYFLDSDDKIMNPSILKNACRKMDEQQLEVLVGAGATFYDSEALREKFPQYENRYRITHEYNDVFSGPELIDTLRKNNEWAVPPATRIFRRTFLLENNLFYIEGQLHEDAYYALVSLFLAKRAGVICQAFYGRRIREDSIMTQKITYKNVLGYLINMIEGLRFLEQHRDTHELDTRIGYTPIGAKKDTVRTYLLLDQKERKRFLDALTAEQKYYFQAFIKDEITYKEANEPLSETIEKVSTIIRYKNEKPDVVIAFICDKTFLAPTMVAVQSVIDHKDENDYYRIYIICSNLSVNEEREFAVLGEETVDICCIRTDTKKYEMFRNTEKSTMSNVSISALLKFDLPNILQESKVLYLDADILIRSNLRKIYETQIDKYYLAAVADSSSMYVKRDPVYHEEEYFNSGVMLLNLNLLRKDHITDKLIETKKKLNDFSLMDQNVFNLVMAGNVKLLPVRYNYMCVNLRRSAEKWDFKQLNAKYNTTYKDLSELERDAVVVHFASKDKPWINSEVPFYREWYETFEKVYIKKTEHSGMEGFFEKVLFNELCEWRDRCKTETEEKNRQKKKIRKLRTDLKKQRVLLKKIKKSRSYRIGRWVTWPWRWIKKQMRCRSK